MRLLAGDSEQGDHRVRSPGQEPESDHGQNDDSQLDFGSFRLVAIRLDLLGCGHFAENVKVAEGDDREGNDVGEDEEDEHEDACGCRSVQIVEAAAGEESFGNVFTESDVECGNDGEEGAVQPDEDHHQSGADAGDRSQGIQRIDDDKVAIDGNGR